jgi:hypothetical protein
MINFIKNILRPANNFKIQSFTFYIPSPPPRTTGYREKQFDKLFYDFINKGFEVISINTESSVGTKQSGMWVLCLVRAKNEEASKLNLDDLASELETTPIDGLYYLENEKNESI